MSAVDLIESVCEPHLLPYHASEGWVIGYDEPIPGVTSRRMAHRAFPKGVTPEEASSRLLGHLGPISRDLSYALMKTETTPDQFHALVSLAYDIGVTALCNSELMKLHCAGQIAPILDSRARAMMHTWGGQPLPASAADHFLAFCNDGEGRWTPQKFNRRWTERSRYVTAGSSAAA